MTSVLVVVGLLANGCYILAFAGSFGSFDELMWWWMAPIMFVWSAIPYVGIEIGSRVLSKNLTSQVILFATALLITIGGAYILIYNSFQYLNSYSGLVLLLLSLFQCVPLAIGLGLVMLTRILGKQNPQPSTEEGDG